MNLFVVVFGKMYFLCKKAEVSFLDPKQISYHAARTSTSEQ